jgi:hypothetical protein
LNEWLGVEGDGDFDRFSAQMPFHRTGMDKAGREFCDGG